MSRLRIGFLLPHYGRSSHSHMPAAMRLLADRGVEVEVVHPLDRVVHLHEIRVEHDLYVLKSTSPLALSIAGALHAQGAAIVNPYPATVALHDRAITSRILETAGVPTPAACVAKHAERVASLLDGGALVVKPHQGSGGVRLVRSVAELAAYPPGKEPVFAQRYRPASGRDRKLYSIGNRLFGVLKVFPPRSEAEKHGEPFTPGPELCEIARRCGQAFGLDLYGVDVVESEGRPYVVDMCSMPGFKGVPDAASLLASYFHRTAELAAGGHAPTGSPDATHDVQEASVR